MAENRSGKSGGRGEAESSSAPEAQPGAQSQSPAEGGAAEGGGTTQQQLESSHGARAAADQKLSNTRVGLPGTDVEPGGDIGTTDRPLAGISPAGVAQAGGPEAHQQFVASDPHAYASMPGKQGVEAVGSGTPVPTDAQDAMRERANAGIPEPPKVGPVPNVTLWDTPGGFQVTPAGVHPDQLPQFQGSVRPQQGNYPQAPYGAEAGAEQLPVAGPGAE